MLLSKVIHPKGKKVFYIEKRVTPMLHDTKINVMYTFSMLLVHNLVEKAGNMFMAKI